jgi:hypothetical protein
LAVTHQSKHSCYFRSDSCVCVFCFVQLDKEQAFVAEIVKASYLLNTQYVWRREFVTVFEGLLDPGEEVIWSGVPEKKAYLLPAFGGIPFALIFLAFAYLILATAPAGLGGEQWILPIFILCWVVFLFVVPPVWQFKKFSKVSYLITNRRLLINSGVTKNDVWFADLDKIKETIVKTSIVDKVLGTGKLYPITAEYPYAPQLRSYSRGGMYNLKRVFNVAEGKYEEVTEYELYMKSLSHPHLQGLEEPYAVQKLLKETILGAGAYFVSCEYCHYRYDLNKTGKCPHCGAAKA